MQSVARRTQAPTRLSIGPSNAGRRMTWEEFAKADWQEGFRYELIDGRLTASPAPEFDHSEFSNWIEESLREYMKFRPDVINHISSKARIFIPGRPGITVPEPDLAVYHGVPAKGQRPKGFSWRDIDPILVVEVLSPGNHDKDVVRNVSLYELLPSIREYWIADALDGDERMTLTIHRRRGAKWQHPITIHLGQGGEYTTKLLPGFRLRLDPIS